MKRNESFKTRLKHRAGAFTLVEILVVMAIIAILAAMAFRLLGSAGTQARIARTQVLLKRLDAIVQERLRMIDENKLTVDITTGMVTRGVKFPAAFASQIEVLDGMSNVVSGKVPEILARKAAQRRAFPVRNADLLGWDTADAWDDSPVTRVLPAPVMLPGVTAIMDGNVNQCSEALFRALSPTGEPIDGISTDLQIDSDNDGNLELVDAWGEPIRFYLWPTRGLIPSLVTSGSGVDTVDPNGLLNKSPGPYRYRVPPPSMGSGTAINEDSLHDLGVYAPFLFVSAGPDRSLGFYEPCDSTNYGYLAAIKTESDALDNVTNRQGK